MCGIVGYISTKEKAHVDEKAHFMRFALALDTLRGPDSTGVMTLHKRFKVHTVKTLMAGDRFVNGWEYRKAWKPGWAQVGHNRAATVGKVKVENAHPFEDGPVSLVHNGTLWAEGSTLPLNRKDIEVDSHQLTHNFAEHSPEKAKEVLEKIDGAFALVWYDRRDESINMARNSERPLHLGMSRSKDIIWFMSEGNHLQAINKSMGQRPAAATSIYQLDTGKHLKWRKGNMVPEVTTFVPFMHYGTTYWQGGVVRRTGNDGPKHVTNQTALKQATDKWKKDVEKLDGTKDYTGGSPRVMLGGLKRKVPEPMLEALKGEYNLTPNDLLQFTPGEVTKLTNSKWMVLGSIEHKEWNCEWPAILYDAQQVHTTAYHSRDWLVQPIGIAHPWTDKSSCPAVLCTLIHCSWADYAKNVLTEVIDKEAQDRPKVPHGTAIGYTHTSFIDGPGGLLVPYGKIRKLMEAGCISCGCDLSVGNLKKCCYVNEGRDILCYDCTQDLSGGSYQ